MADLEETIQQGDRIMEVNKQDLRNATQEHAAQVLKVSLILVLRMSKTLAGKWRTRLR